MRCGPERSGRILQGKGSLQKASVTVWTAEILAIKALPACTLKSFLLSEFCVLLLVILCLCFLPC